MKQLVKHCIFFVSRSRRRFSERSFNFSLIAMRRSMSMTVCTMTFMLYVSFSTSTVLLVDDAILGREIFFGLSNLFEYSFSLDLFTVFRSLLITFPMILTSSPSINFLFSFSSFHFPLFTLLYNRNTGPMSLHEAIVPLTVITVGSEFDFEPQLAI